MSEVRYPMGAVSQRTGLSPHVLRVWERRYGAVTPERTDTNRRLYTEEEIRRLEYLSQLTSAGHGISQIAALPFSELASLAAKSDASRRGKSSRKEGEDSHLDEAWSCVCEMDSATLHTVLDRAAVVLGLSKLSLDVIVPLIERIGASWELGDISPAEEHAASAVIKEVLFSSSRPFAPSTSAPNFLVTTPRGQLHELGAALVCCLARRDGWNVTYLGPSLPATEIARAAISNDSIAVGLSIVYPADDPTLAEELLQLRQSLPDHVQILIGGRSAHHYKKAIAKSGGLLLTNLDETEAALQELRSNR